MSTVRAARPAAAEPIAMPSDDGVRLHDDQGGAPVPPTSRESQPKESVACPEAASRRSVEGRQLLPQRQVFQDQFPMAAERQRECADDHEEQFQHAVDRGWSRAEIQLGRVVAMVSRMSSARPSIRPSSANGSPQLQRLGDSLTRSLIS